MITHNISTISVFQTDQYKNFSFINGNRALNQKKIKKIIKEIEAGNDMLKYYPILVSVVEEKLQVLDGQHRFFICKKLKRPVYYILASDDKSMSEIAKVNSNVEKWKPQDFINCYLQQGNENYLQLQKFIDIYGFNIGTSANLLHTGIPEVSGLRNELNNNFEGGTFEVKEWDKAVSIAEDCKLFDSLEFWQGRAFIQAIYRIRKAGLVKPVDLVVSLNKYPGSIERQHSYKHYLQALEVLFNKGKQKRTLII